LSLHGFACSMKVVKPFRADAMRCFPSLFVAISILLISAIPVYAKNKHPAKQPPAQQDEIAVLAHLPLTAGPITRFLTTQHYRREYLYAENESSKAVTLLDITTVQRPAVLAEMTFPSGMPENLVAVTGNVALVSNTASLAASSMTPQSFRILNFADPLHPTVQQEFTGVTALSRDDRRGLIFLANPEGIWILQQRLALSPEDEKLQKEILHSIFDTP
jgi:hypothetical protein